MEHRPGPGRQSHHDRLLLDDLNGGDGITINDDSSRPDFTVISSTGVEVDIDLGVLLDEDDEVDEEAVTTVGELLSRERSALG